MIELKTPLKESEVKKLSVEEFVSLTGTIFTARDKAHEFLLKNPSKEFKTLLKDSVIFHCGPIAKKESSEWKILSAGPTTSSRMNSFTPELIKKYKIKAIIGKGGMDSSVLKACKENSCVYLHTFSGCGALLSEKIQVENVSKLKEFGSPEAIWQLKVTDFPALVSMDAKGNSLHETLLKETIRRKNKK